MKQVWVPVSRYGMIEPDPSEHLDVVERLAVTVDWDQVPVTNVRLDVDGPPLHASEAVVDMTTVDRVARKGLKSGYHPHLAVLDGVWVVVDGHHRVAVHRALRHNAMPAKVHHIDGEF